MTLGVDGRLVSIDGPRAEVDVRGKRLRVALADVRRLEPERVPSEAVPLGSVTLHVKADDGPFSDLNVIGCTVVEACDRVEKYLDQAVLHAQSRVRIIHGHGTGRLRRSIAGLLDEHPLVDRFEAAPPNEGGDGATIVVLRD
jgi:DNA mismatch repair protein MutS2